MAQTAASSVSDVEIFEKYFGTYSTQNAAKLQDLYSSIASHLLIGTVSYECMSPSTECDPGDFAYVFRNEPYTLYICSDFFTLPAHTDVPSPPLKIDDMWGGQEGTFIHEMSHFENVSGTVDEHKGRKIYGRSQCEALAATEPGSTIDIADCVQYFAEDVTPPILLEGF